MSRPLSLLICLFACLVLAGTVSAQTYDNADTFTYQGYVLESGSPVTGTCDFRFSLFDAVSGGSQIGDELTQPNLQVNAGVFYTALNFGVKPFSTGDRYLQIAVNCGNGETTLTPRQPIYPAPLAMAMPGLYTQPNANSPNVIGGWQENQITNGAYGVVIAGGGSMLQFNTASADHTTISGGLDNKADGIYSVIGGGFSNDTLSSAIVVGGGSNNSADGAGSVIGGGESNQTDAFLSTIGGGQGNQTYGAHSTIGGGEGNQVYGVYGTIAGGGPAFGNNNFVYDDHGVIGGGGGNIAGTTGSTTDATYPTIAGGFRNRSEAAYTTVGGGATNFATGQYGTVAGGNSNDAIGASSFVGGGVSNDAEGLESAVAGGRSNRALGENSIIAGGESNTTNGENSAIGGGTGNTVNGQNSIVSGGSTNTANGIGSTVGGGVSNRNPSDYGTIGGGDRNQVMAAGGTIGGGGAWFSPDDNVDVPNAVLDEYGTIGGGAGNWAGTFDDFNDVVDDTLVFLAQTDTTDARYATVAGGVYNWAEGEYSFVGGGFINYAGAYGSVGGGYVNDASGAYSAIPGGRSNFASGAYSFAAGYNATANDNGAFVWSDSRATPVSSPGVDTFSVSARNGIWLGSTQAPDIPTGQFISTSTGAYLTTTGIWQNNSDVNAKTDFEAVDTQAVLEGVANMPISSWRYLEEDTDAVHMGPMAQDFHAAFGLGTDETSIGTIDADGVALASIQALYERVESQEQRIASLERQLLLKESGMNMMAFVLVGMAGYWFARRRKED